MVSALRSASLLDASRGRPAGDTASLVQCLYALADFPVAHADRIAEIDLNPIKILAVGEGCRIVDALIFCRNSF
jgi:hypothetical protein